MIARLSKAIISHELPQPARDQLTHNLSVTFVIVRRDALVGDLHFQVIIMSVRRIWLISVAERSVIYLKTFPIVDIQARKLGLPVVPTFRGYREENEFVHSLFKGLGIDNFLTLKQLQASRSARSSRSGSISSNCSSVDDFYFNENRASDFDCSVSNQLPVVAMTFKDMRIWPVLVVEHGGILFCGLPLIKGESTELIDHISISTAFAALQAIIKQYTRENVGIERVSFEVRD